MICKQTDTCKMFFPLSVADIYIWRDAWKNVAQGVGSPGELSKFAGAHHCKGEEEKGTSGRAGH